MCFNGLFIYSRIYTGSVFSICQGGIVQFFLNVLAKTALISLFKSRVNMISKVENFPSNLKCNYEELSDEATEPEQCLTHILVADQELLEAIIADAKYHQTFCQIREAQRDQTIKAAKRMIKASNVAINLFTTTQI